MIKINVGGKTFYTRKPTIEKCEFFSTLLSVRWPERDDHGDLFVDRSHHGFDLILKYLRGEPLSIGTMPYHQRVQLISDSIFYGIPSLTVVAQIGEFDMEVHEVVPSVSTIHFTICGTQHGYAKLVENRTKVCFEVSDMEEAFTAQIQSSNDELVRFMKEDETAIDNPSGDQYQTTVFSVRGAMANRYRTSLFNHLEPMLKLKFDLHV